MKRIIVEIREGLVSAVYVDGESKVEVDVLDYDCFENILLEDEEKYLLNLEAEAKTLNCVY